MTYSDHEQALRVASAISGVTTGCCLRYGLFASILRQSATTIDESVDAFRHYYDLRCTIGLLTAEDVVHSTAGTSNGLKWSASRASCCRLIRHCYRCRRSWA
jgi:hypothetical protein